MSKKLPWIIVCIVVLLLTLLTVFLKKGTGNETTFEQLGKERALATVSIFMTKSGFSPDKVSIHVGQSVRFVNALASDCPLAEAACFFWPASDPHPTHEFYPVFDSRDAIAPGETWTFVFDRPGSWGFHNHFNSGQVGTIEVLP